MPPVARTMAEQLARESRRPPPGSPRPGTVALPAGNGNGGRGVKGGVPDLDEEHTNLAEGSGRK
jgi:hypothetical protein